MKGKLHGQGAEGEKVEGGKKAEITGNVAGGNCWSVR